MTNGIEIKDKRIIILAVLQPKMLKQINSKHFGVEKKRIFVKDSV